MTKRKKPEDLLKNGAPEFPYTDELGEEICTAIATSDKGLDDICAENKHFPVPKVIYKWTWRHPNFGKMYDKARDRQQDLLVAKMLKISEDSSRDYYVDEKGIERPHSVAIQRDSLYANNVKWQAARLSKRYKDKTVVENHNISHEGGLKDLK